MLVSHAARGGPNSEARFTLVEMKYPEAEKSPLGMIYRSYRGGAPIVSVFSSKSLYYLFSPSIKFPNSDVDVQANIFWACSQGDTFLMTAWIDEDTFAVNPRSAVKLKLPGMVCPGTPVKISDSPYRLGDSIVVEGVVRAPADILLARARFEGVPFRLPRSIVAQWLPSEGFPEMVLALSIPIESVIYARHMIGSKVTNSHFGEAVGIVTEYYVVEGQHGYGIEAYLILKVF